MSAGIGSKIADVAHRGVVLLCAGGLGWAGFKIGQSAYRGTLLANFRKQAEEGRADMYSLPRLGEEGQKRSQGQSSTRSVAFEEAQARARRRAET